MELNDWKPEFYLKFDKERILPTIDLVNRIEMKSPEKIIDIGCGPGNSTRILLEKWPESKITGVDNSPAMIERAKKDIPQLDWQLIDAGKDEINGKYDIVFSNATIQWIPNHYELLLKLSKIITDNGLIAIQLPSFWDMPIGKTIAQVAENKRWAAATKKVTSQFTIHDYSFYYNQLSKLFRNIDIWETHYMHIMDSHQAILEMIASTGLRPYLANLKSEQDREDFKNSVLENIRVNYPKQEDGKVIFPFHRMFFIAQNRYES
jgi:trans-aconitate 2-methyltransferase